MMATRERPSLELLRELIGERLGLRFEDGKLEFLSTVLRERLERTGDLPPEAYVARLSSPMPWLEEWRALAERLTVTETYFFRYWDHFRVFSEVVLPACLERRGDRREVRMLSAGCASGEEAYSLAALTRDRLGSWSGDCAVKITGIDINPAMIQRAQKARYSQWSLRETPEDLKSRNFQSLGRDFALDASVQGMVEFEERNLLKDDPGFWTRGAFDVVFCRNVLMYFLPDAMAAVVGRIARALKPGGFLFLGHAETLRGITEEFHLCHSHGTFYYEKRQGGSERREAPRRKVGPVGAPQPPLPLTAALGSDVSWVDAIQRASRRIASLADGPASQQAPLPQQEAKPRWDLETAVELLSRERFSAAMDHLRALPPESEKDRDVLLLAAVIHTNKGDLAAAEEACKDLLETDDMNAGAHYLMALCSEHAGARDEAVHHDQTAAYVDPGFAMPRLHLGLLAKKAGKLEEARRELGHALLLLKQEDASRILLFGGGFRREALMDLCQKELVACGGTP